MLAAIPVPKEVQEHVRQSAGCLFHPDMKVVTDDLSLIAQAGLAAVHGQDTAAIMAAMDIQVQTPPGFTAFGKQASYIYLHDNVHNKVTNVLKRLYADGTKNDGQYGTWQYTAIYPLPCPRTCASMSKIDLLARARVEKHGILITDADLKLFQQADPSSFKTQQVYDRYTHAWEPHISSELKRSVIVNDEYVLSRLSAQLGVRLLYAPSVVKRLRKSRALGEKRRVSCKCAFTPHSLLLEIIRAYDAIVWERLNTLADRWYCTQGLKNTATSILNFHKTARRIHCLAACRKNARVVVKSAWWHRKIYTRNIGAEFMNWLDREWKLIGKPKEAAAIIRDERIKLAKRRARQLAKQQKLTTQLVKLQGGVAA